MTNRNTIEAPVAGPVVEELKGWASLWGDLLHVEVTLHARTRIPVTAPNLFARRALWEAAVTSYWRTANTGRRRQQINELLSVVGGSAETCHAEIERWRNQHVAHRVDQERELVDVRAVVREGGDAERVVVRVSPVLGPDEEGSDLPQRFTAHVRGLKDFVWQQRIVPAEREIVGAQAGRGDELRRAAAEAAAPPDAKFTITINPTGTGSSGA